MAVNQPNLCFVLVSEAVKPIDNYVKSLEYNKDHVISANPKHSRSIEPFQRTNANVYEMTLCGRGPTLSAH